MLYGWLHDLATRPFETNWSDVIGRFRVNIFKQRNEVAMVIRTIKTEIPDYRNLGLPDTLPKLVMQKRGLVLFVGGTCVVMPSFTPQAFRIWIARPEKPHIGNCAVPFMNSTTGLPFTRVSMRCWVWLSLMSDGEEVS